jgi:hypothetical protein
MDIKKIAITAGGVIVGSMAVGPILNAVGIKQEDGFGMDDVAAALIVASAILLVDKLI